MLELPRREFLAGLGALIAAPAVVHAANLMPVSPIYHDRILVMYDIRFDADIVRWDRARFDLPAVNESALAKKVSVSDLRRLPVSRRFIEVAKGMRPSVGEQMHAEFILPNRHCSHGLWRNVNLKI